MSPSTKLIDVFQSLFGHTTRKQRSARNRTNELTFTPGRRLPTGISIGMLTQRCWQCPTHPLFPQLDWSSQQRFGWSLLSRISCLLDLWNGRSECLHNRVFVDDGR